MLRGSSFGNGQFFVNFTKKTRLLLRQKLHYGNTCRIAQSLCIACNARLFVGIFWCCHIVCMKIVRKNTNNNLSKQIFLLFLPKHQCSQTTSPIFGSNTVLGAIFVASVSAFFRGSSQEWRARAYLALCTVKIRSAFKSGTSCFRYFGIVWMSFQFGLYCPFYQLFYYRFYPFRQLFFGGVVAKNFAVFDNGCCRTTAFQIVGRFAQRRREQRICRADALG